MLAIAEQQPLNETKMPYLEPLAILEIDDPIRQNAKETLAYLKEEGIDLKVISGDNPVTVSNIARRAGLPGYESYIDLSTKRQKQKCEKRFSNTQYSDVYRLSKNEPLCVS